MIIFLIFLLNNYYWLISPKKLQEQLISCNLESSSSICSAFLVSSFTPMTSYHWLWLLEGVAYHLTRVVSLLLWAQTDFCPFPIPPRLPPLIHNDWYILFTRLNQWNQHLTLQHLWQFYQILTGQYFNDTLNKIKPRTRSLIFITYTPNYWINTSMCDSNINWLTSYVLLEYCHLVIKHLLRG